MSSKPQVTITLGRSGQVVKRRGPILEATPTNYMPPSEGKRPITERLGTNSENHQFYGSLSGNKRQRSENGNWSSRDDVNDDSRRTSRRRVGRDDLRLKLMHKSLSRRTNIDADVRSQVDLREKLSRSTQIPLRFDARQDRSEPKASNLVRRIPPTRSADDLSPMDSLRKSYSAWTLDGLRCRSPDGFRCRSPDGFRRRSPEVLRRRSQEVLRRRSPDRLLGASRGFSPSRTVDEMRRGPSIRPVDPSRPAPFVTKGVIDASRSAPLMTKPMAPVVAPKPVARLPPPNGIMPKSSYLADEPLTVGSLLQSLGLGKYSILFQAEEVDLTALKQMGDNDLKELGIPMGPRKKILLAVLPRVARRHS